MKAMTTAEAFLLEQNLTTTEPTSAVNIVHKGTIEITDEYGKTETHVLYSAAEIIRLLDSGHDIRTVIKLLHREPN